MTEKNRFEPLCWDRVSPQELRAAMREEADPFEEFACGDPSRARQVLLYIGARFTTYTPFVTEDGLSLLHFAARFDLREAAATLLDWGVQVDVLTWPHQKVGPLWRRLGAGLAVNIVGEYELGARSLSPLHLAVMARHESMVGYLLGRGANPRRKVGLDHGPEGIEPANMGDLTRGWNYANVRALLEQAEPRASEPVENAWLDTGLPHQVGKLLGLSR